MSASMIERVAAAIAMENEGWTKNAKDYIPHARAVMKVMREPTEAMELARAVLAQSITAGHNVPGPTPEDIEKAFWALDAALEAQAAELAEVRQQYVDANEARIDAEAQLAERGKPFIAAAEEAYWLLAWTWQSHLTGPGKPFDMSVFAPEARNMMTKAEQDLFDALSEIEP